MFYSDEIIEEVRERNDIVDVIGQFVKLKRTGNNYMGLCPFHGEKTPSFSVSKNKQMYHCFGCGASGNVFTFLMNYENMTFPEAVKNLADKAGMELPEQGNDPEARERADRKTKLLAVNKDAATFYYYNLRTPEGSDAMNYLKKRELSDETINSFGLGFSPKASGALYAYLKKKGYPDDILRESGLFNFDKGRDVLDKFWNRVMYPIMDMNNKVIGFGGRVMGDAKPKYLNSPETFIFNKRRNLYGLNIARRTRLPYFIICEGYMDVISMHQAGFNNAVASLGTALTEEQCNLIARYVKEVYLTYDSDEAGVKATLRAIPMMKEAGVGTRIIRMEPYKDPDEFIKGLGKEEFQKRIDEAENAFYFEVDILERNFNLSDPEGKTSFFNALARKLVEIPDELERDTYLQAIAARYMVAADMLRRLVNRIGAGAAIRKESEEAYRKAVKSDRKKTGDEGLKQSERLLLTWICEKPELYEKIRDDIQTEDFTDPFYKEVAGLLFTEIENEGKGNPAKILNHFDTGEDQEKAAKLFNENLIAEVDEQGFLRAFNETFLKIRTAGLARALKDASERGDVAAMNEIIKKQSELKNRR